MTAAELIKINSKPMELMSNADLRTSDYQYLPLYDEYQQMRDNGEKVNYIIAHLADSYHVSESSVKRIIKRLSKEVKV